MYLQPTEEYSKDAFVVSSIEYSKDLNQTALLFNIPPEVTVRINQTSFPGEIFDYFNPLIVRNDLLDKIKFCNGPEVIKTFKCQRLTPPDSIIQEINNFLNSGKKIFAYTHTLGISYPSMKVVQLTGIAPQMFNFLLEGVVNKPVIESFLKVLNNFTGFPGIRPVINPNLPSTPNFQNQTNPFGMYTYDSDDGDDHPMNGQDL